ncbi:hypothetical protein SASPL_104227 [Salvia splendens]|uniref:Uncharacterized protein n=1 Tax=Salvia splendens TaxID=180675 RepID=A0A8X8YME0_SALSN|nr:hypothetical protein SASPL_104227 [Salvia splendens]
METVGLTLTSFVFQQRSVVEGVFRPLLGEEVVFRPLLGVEVVFRPVPAVDLENQPEMMKGGATPTRYIAGGEGGASPTGGLAGGEGDATLMSDEEFKQRYVVTEAGKALWEKCKASDEGDATLMSDEEFCVSLLMVDVLNLVGDVVTLVGDVVNLVGDVVTLVGDVVNLVGDVVTLVGDVVNLVGDVVNFYLSTVIVASFTTLTQNASLILSSSNDSTVNLSRNSLFAAVRLGLMADVCGIIRPSLTHLHTVVFEQPKPTATLKRLHLLEKCILFNRSTSRCSLLGIPPPCTGLPGDCKLQLCFLKCATRRYTAHTPSDDELDYLVLEF